MPNKTVVLGVTGGIAAYKAADLASKLTQAGLRVEVIMTEATTKFILPLTFRSLTGRPVVTDMFELASEFNLEHVALAEAADVVVIAPATADIIAKMACGIADDMLTTTVLATTAPVIVAPAMHASMYENMVTQENLARLKARGFTIVGPERGRLASGEVGWGRLVDNDEIIAAVKQVLGRNGDLAGKRVVVTAGGTQEPIDPVRHIGNRSSGKMGYAITEAARDRGAIVTLITAPVALKPPHRITVVNVETAAQMKEAVEKAVANADVLVMAAAVADYQPKVVASGKIKKDAAGDRLTLELVRTPDILGEVKGDFIRVGFAAESENVVENARQKLLSKRLDLIVANDITATDSGFGVDTNRVTLIGKDGKAEDLPLMSKREVAEKVLDRVVGIVTTGEQPDRSSITLRAKAHIGRKYLQIGADEFRRGLMPDALVQLVTDIGPFEVSVIRPHGGDGDAELHKDRKLAQWFASHPEVRDMDPLLITVIEPMKKYRLEVPK